MREVLFIIEEKRNNSKASYKAILIIKVSIGGCKTFRKDRIGK